MAKKGIYNVNFVDELSTNTKKSASHYSWADQSDWGFKCKTGIS